MYEIFIESFSESLKMIPFLLFIYIAIELVEYKYGNKVREKLQTAGNFGPFFGAILGSFPQCGISVITTVLYTQRLATIGTLIAVYLSTSDEAIPVMLSNPGKIKIVIFLILTKVIVAIIGGCLVDFFYRKNNRKIVEHIDAYAHGHDYKSHHHEMILDIKACCNHLPLSTAKKFNINEIFLHPIKHTLKIFTFIFIFSFLLNFMIFNIGEKNLEHFFLGHFFLQPFFTALFGLIPNCATSVVIAELYLKNIISFGSVVAGLSVSGGLGLLILFQEEKKKVNVIKIVLLLFVIGLSAGLIVNLFPLK